MILFTLLGLTLAGGVAAADRSHDRRDHRPGRVVERDHRWNERDHRWNERDHRWNERDRARVSPQRRVVHRRPVYINNGYYQFHNGTRYRYTRPVIHRRYFDVRVRPQLVAESYQAVPGYSWVAGQWQWNGYEWRWISGHYAADPSYVEYQSY